MSCFKKTAGRLALVCFASLAACIALPARALDAGRYGTVYTIREPDLLEEIKRTVQSKVDSGEWKRLQAEVQQRANVNLANPPPVGGVVTAVARRSWLHDPSIILSEDVRDGDNRVVYPAGTRVNPLDIVAMPQALLFFDGRDTRQVEAARRLIEQRNVMPVLVAGSWQSLGKRWQRQVYFDQQGRLVQQLGIQAVPALVTQETNVLRIEEFVP